MSQQICYVYKSSHDNIQFTSTVMAAFELYTEEFDSHSLGILPQTSTYSHNTTNSDRV